MWFGITICLRIFYSLLLSTQSKTLGNSMKQMFFFWNSLAFLYDPMDVGDLIAGSSAFTKIHLIHLEVLSSHTVEAYLERF